MPLKNCLSWKQGHNNESGIGPTCYKDVYKVDLCFHVKYKHKNFYDKILNSILGKLYITIWSIPLYLRSGIGGILPSVDSYVAPTSYAILGEQ